METEVISNICGQSGVLQAFRIVAYIINIIRVLIPVVLVLTSIKSLFMAFMDEKTDVSASVKMFITKFIIGCCILFIPTVFYAIFDYISDSKDTIDSFATCGVCLTNISDCNSKIEEAKEREIRLAEAKAEEFRTRKEKALLEEKEKEKAYEEERKNKKSTVTSGYGKGCTSFVSSSSYDAVKAQGIINKGKSQLGTEYVYGGTDCSWFVGYAASDYIYHSSAAGEANQTKDKCVQATDVKPGDLFFASQYDSSYTCQNCAKYDRCERFDCIMHVGIVYEVQNGEVTKILHNGSDGVAIVSRTYDLYPTDGKQWVIMYTRPYA